MKRELHNLLELLKFIFTSTFFSLHIAMVIVIGLIYHFINTLFIEFHRLFEIFGIKTTKTTTTKNCKIKKKKQQNKGKGES